LLKKAKVGQLKIQTKYTFPEPGAAPKTPGKMVVSPPAVASKAGVAALWKGCSVAKFDSSQAMAAGLKAAIALKIEEH
jgi:hypothetical protein